MKAHRIVKELDGTAGGSIVTSDGLDASLKFIQIAISGRTAGILTVTGQTDGGEASEPFSTPLTINLGSGEYTVFPIGGFVSLTFTPDAPGDDFTVTLRQWVG